METAMKTMNVRELRQATPHLKQTLAEAGEVLLVSNGEPIARLLPIVPKARSRLPSMKAFRATMPTMSVPSEVLIREERDRRGT
jgi:antitoxin (DNA-binding transcriptional repressor) of toxin-antitoxin stability system